MKFFLFLYLFLVAFIQVNAEFRDYFVNKTMRIDYYHTADKTTEIITIDKIYLQGPGTGIWAGNPNALIDTFDNGQYYIKVYDEATGQLIYSKGFNSYCGEYITTDMADKGIKKTYHETALIPYPKKKIKFTLERRDKQNQLHPLFERVIDPTSIDIRKEPLIGGVTVFDILRNGPSHKKVDLAIVAEGYTNAEEEKFKKDLETIIEVFFNQEPYKSHKDHFNVYGVFKPSPDSGADEPTHSIYKNTAVGASFNALGLYRYMLTEENRALRDIAAHAPYDTLVIMVNTKRYGGGGIYNTYCLFSLEEEWYAYVLLHEFGHSFAGLADEYYSSVVAYNEFYPQGVEPTEPNITALLDPQNLKWKHLVTKRTKIPTPWEKEKYEQMNGLQKRAHLAKKEFQNQVGVFEGAGYSSEGLYRPMANCIMFSRANIPYCKVCEEAIIKVIQHYTR
ncbi:MAG: peptidase M64 [Candidatus Aminicenantes bacterium]|nr:MAG: peptidase M64 [Candidatus Aminicenantes bacterium]